MRCAIVTMENASLLLTGVPVQVRQQDDMARRQSLLHVDQPLIAGAAKAQRNVLQLLYKASSQWGCAPSCRSSSRVKPEKAQMVFSG